MGCQPAQAFAWLVVDFVDRGAQLLFWDLAEVGAFRVVPSESAVVVFVGASLPRLIRVSEVCVYLVFGDEYGVQVLLGAVVHRGGLARSEIPSQTQTTQARETHPGRVRDYSQKRGRLGCLNTETRVN